MLDHNYATNYPENGESDHNYATNYPENGETDHTYAAIYSSNCETDHTYAAIYSSNSETDHNYAAIYSNNCETDHTYAAIYSNNCETDHNYASLQTENDNVIDENYGIIIEENDCDESIEIDEDENSEMDEDENSEMDEDENSEMVEDESIIETTDESESMDVVTNQYGGGIVSEVDEVDINQRGGSFINIISRNKRNYKRLNASGLRLEIKFNPPTMHDIAAWVKLCVADLLKIMEDELEIQPQDRVGIIFSNTNNARVDFSISFRPFSQYSTDTIFTELERVVQSNTLFFTDDNLIIHVDHVKMPIGYGRRSHIGKTTDKYFKIHERSIFSPNLQPEDHGLCLAVAIVVGIPHSTNDINKYNYLTYCGNYDDLIQEAQMLCDNACVNLQNGGSIEEIIKFQQYLGSEFRIVVYASRDGKDVLFKACHDEYKYTIHILLDENHYSLILTPTAAFATAYFCGYCCIGYSTKFGHKRCRVKCNKCFQSPPCQNIIDMKCSQCKREFLNATCFHNHMLHKICEKFHACEFCGTVYLVKKNSEHKCGFKYCKICKEEMPIRHECYIAVTKPKSQPKNGAFYVFFDFECYQTKDMNMMTKNQSQIVKEHEVNLCVAHQVCYRCGDVDGANSSCNCIRFCKRD